MPSPLAQEHARGPTGPPAGHPLEELLARANRDANLAALVAGAERALGVGEVALPFVISAVAHLGSRRPVLVAVPGALVAERLASGCAGSWLVFQNSWTPLGTAST